MRPELEAQIKELMYKVGHETGLEDGLEQGFEKGRQEGRQEGRIEGLQRAALQLARECGLTAEEAEQPIVALTDPSRLTNLIVALGRARDADGARMAMTTFAV
jgi:predicted transposase YdaD